MIVSAGQKWLRSEKEYLHYEWTSGANIWMAGGKGGDLSSPKRNFKFRPSHKLFKRLIYYPVLPRSGAYFLLSISFDVDFLNSRPSMVLNSLILLFLAYIIVT